MRFWVLIIGLMAVTAITLNPPFADADTVKPENAYNPARFDTVCVPLRFVSFDTEAVTEISVEVAATPAAKTKGLMNREFLAPDGGMIFIFGQEQVSSFWMKNTLIPLDMIFLAGDGTIMHIHENAIPHDLTPISSQVPVFYGLELRGGTAERLDMQVGDYIEGLDQLVL